MNQETINRIQEAVRASLPAHLSEELQLALKDGDAAKTRLSAANERIAQLEATGRAYQEQIKQHAELAGREAAVRKREEEVLKREIKMELNEYKVAAADKRADDIKEIVKTVFQNNLFKYQRTVCGNDNIPVAPGHSTAYVSRSSDEKIETEGG